MKSLNIVAHPDDDLLFLNPDILNEIENGDEVYNVYLTAGDDGKDRAYYINRRLAIVDTYIQLYGHKPYNLIFLGIKSNSFRTGDIYGDLYSMWSNRNYVAHVIDHYGNKPKLYTQLDLIHYLKFFIELYRPDLIRTQDPDCLAAIDHDEPQLDHLDHIYGAKFVQNAAESFPNLPVLAYESYPLRYQTSNVSPELSAKKKVMWRLYQAMDTDVKGEAWDIALDKCHKRRIQ